MTNQNHNGSAPKITQDQLKKELENGKTQKEIAHEYGYGYPSRVLSDKIRDLGFEMNQTLSLNEHGGAQFYVGSDIVEEALKKRNLEDKEERFFRTNVRESDGVIEIVPTGKKWRKESDE